MHLTSTSLKLECRYSGIIIREPDVVLKEAIAIQMNRWEILKLDLNYLISQCLVLLIVVLVLQIVKFQKENEIFFDIF